LAHSSPLSRDNRRLEQPAARGTRPPGTRQQTKPRSPASVGGSADPLSPAGHRLSTAVSSLVGGTQPHRAYEARDWTKFITSAGESLIPGLMVVERATFRRYCPLAAAGLARIMASRTARRFSRSCSSVKETF